MIKNTQKNLRVFFVVPESSQQALSNKNGLNLRFFCAIILKRTLLIDVVTDNRKDDSKW